MRTIGLGLALAATAQLMLLSSPAMADDTKSTTGYESSPPPRKDSSKATPGWILLGGGGALAIGGIVVDVIGGTGQNQVSGQGATGDTSTTQHTKTDLLFAGTTMIIVGVVAGIYGGSLILDSKRGQDASSSAPPPALGSSDPVSKAAQASLASAPTVVVPVLGARF